MNRKKAKPVKKRRMRFDRKPESAPSQRNESLASECAVRIPMPRIDMYTGESSW